MHRDFSNIKNILSLPDNKDALFKKIFLLFHRIVDENKILNCVSFSLIQCYIFVHLKFTKIIKLVGWRCMGEKKGVGMSAEAYTDFVYGISVNT